jgi:hypothetical protein
MMFDLLNEDFDKPFLCLTVLGVACALYFSKFYADKKRLNQQWK